MEETKLGLYAYNPTDVKVKFEFDDGSILEPYGFALGEQIWMDDGVIYLKIQTTSGFIPVLLDKLLELGTSIVQVKMESSHLNINRVLSPLDGIHGEVRIRRLGLRATDEIPSTLIAVTLRNPQ